MSNQFPLKSPHQHGTVLKTYGMGLLRGLKEIKKKRGFNKKLTYLKTLKPGEIRVCFLDLL